MTQQLQMGEAGLKKWGFDECMEMGMLAFNKYKENACTQNFKELHRDVCDFMVKTQATV